MMAPPPVRAENLVCAPQPARSTLEKTGSLGGVCVHLFLECELGMVHVDARFGQRLDMALARTDAQRRTTGQRQWPRGLTVIGAGALLSRNEKGE